MKALFCCACYYSGQARHPYFIIHIYRKIAEMLELIGVDCRFMCRENNIIPLSKTIEVKNWETAINDFDVLFIWNGQMNPEKRLIERAKQKGIPIIYSELGWLPQAGTFYFDYKGIAVNSSLSDWEYYPLRPEEVKDLNNFLWYYKVAVNKNTIPVKDDFVLVPLQVENDSQIILHSRIKSMQELIDYTRKFIKGKIVYKAHPKDEKKLIIPKGCELVKDNLHGYLQSCKYVVTINSTVGVEALTYGKPVIVLGNAFYGGLGITWWARDDKEFQRAITQAERGIIARGKIASFLYFLMQRQWREKDLNNPEKVYGLIDKLTGEKYGN